MAEEEKMVLLDSSISARRKMLHEEIERRNVLREESMRRKGESMLMKRLREESLLRITLLKAARKHQEKFEDLEDSVPAIGVSIGGYSRFSGKDVCVTACFSYELHSFKWEIVEGPLRRIIVVHWNDIGGLELKLNECGLACLTVEVKYTDAASFQLYMPEFKAWSPIRDFTDDVIWRNMPPHCVVFKPGIVDEIYEKFLNYRKEQVLLREEHQKQFDKQFQKRFQKKQLRRKLQKLSTSESEKEENK